jgi:hypothetical protein
MKLSKQLHGTAATAQVSSLCTYVALFTAKNF